ncbi:MAG: hypothetical protein LBU77_04460 [Clostridiales bacterium]|jgi:hypothetical protein|nr:hypothetical protein [Clostridiales bacterium]
MKEVTNAKMFEAAVAEYVRKKGQACLFLLMDTLKDLDNEEFVPEGFADNELIQEIKAAAADLALCLDAVFDQGPAAVSNAVALLEQQKEKLTAFAKTVYACDHAMVSLEDIWVPHSRCRSAEQLYAEEGDDIDAHGFIADCMDYINSDAVELPREVKKADIMSCFPLRMARQKYNGHVESGVLSLLAALSEADADRLTETLKLRFYSFKTALFSEAPAEIKGKIEALYAVDFESLDEAAAEAAWTENDALTKEIVDMLQYLEMLLEPLIFLLALLKFTADFDALFEDNLVYKDLYYTFKENYSTDNFELIVDNFSGLLDDTLEQVLDDCLEREKQIKKYFRPLARKTPDREQLDAMLLFIRMIGQCDESLNGLCFPLGEGDRDGEEPATAAYQKAAVDDLLSFINQAVAGLSNSRQKLIKQAFLGRIPCEQSDDEVLDYLRYTFGELKSGAERLSAADAVGKLFERHNYNPWPEDDDFDEAPLDHAHDHGHAHDHDHHDGCCGHRH